MSFRGKTIDVQGLENPIRKDAANFRKHVAEGGVIYIKNCVYCHGDNLDGNGHFAPAFNPRPANFTDPGTIAMLQEGYLFWRIAKGGPGLPKESAPWNSVMPAWEDRLGEDDIWKVILYLYDATGYQPRRWETQASLSPSSRGKMTMVTDGAEDSGVPPGQRRSRPATPRPARRSTRRSAPSATARKGRGTAPGRPPSIPSHATLPGGCTRSARPLRDSHPRTRTSSGSSQRA